MRAAAIFVFNHQYESNIPRLDNLYAPRFGVRRYLSPFSASTNPQVIPVFESSFSWQGYFAQAIDRLMEIDCSHFMLIADDLILNPAFDEHSILEKLNLGPDDAFTTHLINLGDAPYNWSHTYGSLEWFTQTQHFVPFPSHLPSIEEAKEAFERSRVGYRDTWGPTGEWPGFMSLEWKPRHRISRWLKMKKRGNKIPYPLAVAYSDLIIIPKARYPEFARICGVMAATRLFVEVAIPTAMILTLPSIKTLADVGLGMIRVEGPDADAMNEKYGFCLDALVDGFKPDDLYVHPVKLSQWH